MKKLSLIFIISAMFFYTACSGNSTNSEKEENPDSTNIVIDEDDDTFDTDLTETEESDNDIETDDTETEDIETEDIEADDTETEDIEVDDADVVFQGWCPIDILETYNIERYEEQIGDHYKKTLPDSYNRNTEYVAENCKIDESYTASSFSEYFTLKSIFVIDNDINGTTDTTAKLYIENSDYSFESNTVYDMSTASTYTQGLNFYTGVYTSIGNGICPTLSVSARITNDQISSGEKDENGRITVKSAPDIAAYNIDYSEKYSKNAWIKRCLIAINKNMLAGTKNGNVQLCPGEKGTFEAKERIKVGIDVEITSKEEDLLAYINMDRTPDDPDYARLPEDLCTFTCMISGAEMNKETGKCECPEGTHIVRCMDFYGETHDSCEKY